MAVRHPHDLLRAARPDDGHLKRISGGHARKIHIPGHTILREIAVDQTRDSVRSGPRRHETKKRRERKREIKGLKATNKLLLKKTHKGKTAKSGSGKKKS
jgi:hypothetical protein